ncbi:hypothetical protein Tco_0110979 [Tanacetum coccineum]
MFDRSRGFLFQARSGACHPRGEIWEKHKLYRTYLEAFGNFIVEDDLVEIRMSGMRITSLGHGPKKLLCYLKQVKQTRSLSSKCCSKHTEHIVQGVSHTQSELMEELIFNLRSSRYKLVQSTTEDGGACSSFDNEDYRVGKRCATDKDHLKRLIIDKHLGSTLRNKDKTAQKGAEE